MYEACASVSTSDSWLLARSRVLVGDVRTGRGNRVGLRYDKHSFTGWIVSRFELLKMAALIGHGTGRGATSAADAMSAQGTGAASAPGMAPPSIASISSTTGAEQIDFDAEAQARGMRLVSSTWVSVFNMSPPTSRSSSGQGALLRSWGARLHSFGPIVT